MYFRWVRVEVHAIDWLLCHRWQDSAAETIGADGNSSYHRIAYLQIFEIAFPLFVESDIPCWQPVETLGGRRAFLDVDGNAIDECRYPARIQVAENEIAGAVSDFAAEQNVWYFERATALWKNHVALFVDAVANAVDQLFILIW